MRTIKIFDIEITLDDFREHKWALANNFKTKQGWELPTEEYFPIFEMLANMGVGNFKPDQFYWGKEQKILKANTFNSSSRESFLAHAYRYDSIRNDIRSEFMNPHNSFRIKLIRKIK
jgi:hypothetical protein